MACPGHRSWDCVFRGRMGGGSVRRGKCLSNFVMTQQESNSRVARLPGISIQLLSVHDISANSFL